MYGQQRARPQSLGLFYLVHFEDKGLSYSSHFSRLPQSKTAKGMGSNSTRTDTACRDLVTVGRVVATDVTVVGDTLCLLHQTNLSLTDSSLKWLLKTAAGKQRQAGLVKPSTPRACNARAAPQAVTPATALLLVLHPTTGPSGEWVSYNWPFRIALLTISMSCIVLTLALMVAVCRLQSVQVFKMASPIFLCICLIGCIIMYSEMAAIFPELDTPSCVATKWTRHMGFCITFSSLLMKTWRVSLTYRVKSAHKLKLTDNQLLHWLTPILLIMVIYLGAWTISDPPQGVVIKDNYDLKFKQCTYNWWDHSLALGEMLFLAWGVKVCIGVRKAESFFNEARVISFAVYNITAVNVLMASIHLFLAPNAGPDLKYMFGFARTQLSTTVTIFLIFGPKFLHIARGTGDQLERGHTLTPSFSRNGLGLPGEEHAVPLDQENEELKEEIQKMAAQMEFMRIVHMEVQNRHLKPKPGGYFSEKGGLLAVCNTNSTLLGKPMSRSTATAAAVQANKTIVESSDGSVPLVTVECNHSVGGVRTTANRKDSLARGGHMFDKGDELEMVNIRTTNASSSFPAKV
ncbi:GPCR family 3 C-terminal protein [Trinorchestia longiramus]|nr:GPCR family 3 C-terminal protein [Trinorchestia longiramus]